MAKRKKVMGIPIGKKQSPSFGSWVSGGAAVVGGALAARRAFRELRESGPVQKSKEAVGKVADAGQKVSSLAGKAGGGDGPIGKMVSALGGSGGGNGDGKGRSGSDQGHVHKIAWLIDEQIDVGVPRREAYNQWTQFGEFSEIFKGVEQVDQADGEDDKLTWSAKVGPSRRQFDAEITEQLPDKRIAWKASGGANVQGVVMFHELDEELTRINVEMVYRPQGFVEHVGNWFRAARRRVRKDLKLFKNYMELRGEATGEWRGRISKDDGRGDAAVDGSPPSGASDDGDEESGSSSSKRSGSSSSKGTSSGGSSSGSSRSSSSGGSKSSGSRSSGSSSSAKKSTSSSSRSGSSSGSSSKRSGSPKGSRSSSSKRSSGGGSSRSGGARTKSKSTRSSASSRRTAA